MQATLFHKNTTVEISSDKWFTKIETLGAKGVIFDCDGTLADSAAAHLLCLRAAVRDQGFDMVENWYETRDVDAAIDHSIVQFGAHVETVSAIEATVQLLHQLAERAYPLAVITNAERPIATQTEGLMGNVSLLQLLPVRRSRIASKIGPSRALTVRSLPKQPIVIRLSDSCHWRNWWPPLSMCSLIIRIAKNNKFTIRSSKRICSA